MKINKLFNEIKEFFKAIFDVLFNQAKYEDYV